MGTPTRAMSTPASDGPTTAAPLKTDELSAIAFIRSCLPTISTMNACRAGTSKRLTVPVARAAMITIQYSSWPLALRAKSPNDGIVNAEVDLLPREGGEARRRASGQRHTVPLLAEPPRWKQGEARGGAGRLQQVDEMRRQVHQGAAQGDLVLCLHRAQGRFDPIGLRDGLRAQRAASFRRRAPGAAIRGRDSQEHGIAEALHRVGQGAEA